MLTLLSSFDTNRNVTDGQMERIAISISRVSTYAW